MSTRREWQETRARVIAAARSRCHDCGIFHVSLDVIRTRDGLIALCRSHRCKRDGKQRARKAAETKRLRAMQLRLPHVSKKKRAA